MSKLHSASTQIANVGDRICSPAPTGEDGQAPHAMDCSFELHLFAATVSVVVLTRRLVHQLRVAYLSSARFRPARLLGKEPAIYGPCPTSGQAPVLPPQQNGIRIGNRFIDSQVKSLRPEGDMRTPTQGAASLHAGREWPTPAIVRCRSAATTIFFESNYRPVKLFDRNQSPWSQRRRYRRWALATPSGLSLLVSRAPDVPLVPLSRLEERSMVSGNRSMGEALGWPPPQSLIHFQHLRPASTGCRVLGARLASRTTALAVSGQARWGGWRDGAPNGVQVGQWLREGRPC